MAVAAMGMVAVTVTVTVTVPMPVPPRPAPAGPLEFPLQLLSSATIVSYNIPNVPDAVKFKLHFVDLTHYIVIAGNFGVDIVDHVASTVIDLHGNGL